MIDAPPTILKMRKGDRTIVILDTLNIWRMPLKAIGKSIGLPKLEMPPEDASKEDWDTYGKRDVEIIMRAVMMWCDMLHDEDLGGFAPTLAGQALRTFRHRFMKHKILIDNHSAALECSRACYHGGRTEAFYIGKDTGDYYLVDVHSMYPTVMQRYLFPTEIQGYSYSVSVEDLAAYLKKYLVCARVRVNTPEPCYAIHQRDKLLFPTGAFDAALSSPELAYGLSRGHIVGVYDCACYKRAPIFRAFVDELYSRRLQARANHEDVLAWQIKILMNSLYGKFGQRGRVYDTVETTPDLTPRSWTDFDADTGEPRTFRQIMGQVQVLKHEGESTQSHPAIAAHVTAYARMLLWHYITVAGHENVFYVDTDSLLVNKAGYDALGEYIHPDSLGLLGLEDRFTDIDLRGPKDYTMGERVKVKGVKASARWVTEDTVEQEQWSGIRGLLRADSLDMPRTKTIRKHLHRVYDKGVVGPSGRVSPFVLG